MTKAEIIASLIDQARDKDALANGETWRCWLRQPTPEEMANAPWEGNDG